MAAITDGVTPLDIVLNTGTTNVAQPEGTFTIWRNGLYYAPTDSTQQLLGQVENVASLPASGLTDRYYVNTTTASLHRWTGSAWQQIGGLSGPADEALKLTNARNFDLSGKVTTAGAVAFDGTANVTINVTALDATGLSGVIAVGVTTGDLAANNNSGALANTKYVDAGLLLKANVADIYTKLEVDSKLTAVMRFKGVIADKNALDVIESGTPTLGDVYQLLDTGEFWIFNGTTFEKSGSLVDLTNLVTISGAQTITGQKTFSQTILGNASTASTLYTARTINVTGTGLSGTAASFDGSANVSIALAFSTAAEGDNSVAPATTAYVERAIESARVRWTVINP